jgi:hypothetical protein
MNSSGLITFITLLFLASFSSTYAAPSFAESQATQKPAAKKAVKAKKIGYLSCKGKKLYYSKVNGVKGCYTCPSGMKRTSPTRKMNHPKACVNRKGTNTYAKATFKGNVVTCKPSQLKYNNECLACPKGAKYSPTKKACVFIKKSPVQKITGSACQGKGLYRSKIKGIQYCYTCPTGMVRSNQLRKMNHPKACVNRKGKNTYASGIGLGYFVKVPCEKGNNYCKPEFKPARTKAAAAWYKSNNVAW